MSYASKSESFANQSKPRISICMSRNASSGKLEYIVQDETTGVREIMTIDEETEDTDDSAIASDSFAGIPLFIDPNSQYDLSGPIDIKALMNLDDDDDDDDIPPPPPPRRPNATDSANNTPSDSLNSSYLSELSGPPAIMTLDTIEEGEPLVVVDNNLSPTSRSIVDKINRLSICPSNTSSRITTPSNSGRITPSASFLARARQFSISPASSSDMHRSRSNTPSKPFNSSRSGPLTPITPLKFPSPTPSPSISNSVTPTNSETDPKPDSKPKNDSTTIHLPVLPPCTTPPISALTIETKSASSAPALSLPPVEAATEKEKHIAPAAPPLAPAVPPPPSPYAPPSNINTTTSAPSSTPSTANTTPSSLSQGSFKPSFASPTVRSPDVNKLGSSVISTSSFFTPQGGTPTVITEGVIGGRGRNHAISLSCHPSSTPKASQPLADLTSVGDLNIHSGAATNVTAVKRTAHLTVDNVVHSIDSMPREWQVALRKAFGVPLPLCASEVVPGYSGRIPPVLVVMKDYLVQNNGLNQRGIFRLAPEGNEASLVKTQLNNGTFKTCSDVNVIANLLKVWFRDMPARLLDHVRKPEPILSCESAERAGEVIMEHFSDPHKSLMLWLLDLCADVCELSEVNMMVPQNMAIVFAPNLFKLADDNNADPIKLMSLCKKYTTFVEKAIEWRIQDKDRPKCHL